MILFLGQLILFRPFFFFFFCYQCLTGYNKNFVFWSKGCAKFFLDSSKTFFFFFCLLHTPYFLKIFGPLPLGGHRQLPNWPSGRTGPIHIDDLFNYQLKDIVLNMFEAKFFSYTWKQYLFLYIREGNLEEWQNTIEKG